MSYPPSDREDNCEDEVLSQQETEDANEVVVETFEPASVVEENCAFPSTQEVDGTLSMSFCSYASDDSDISIPGCTPDSSAGPSAVQSPVKLRSAPLVPYMDAILEGEEDTHADEPMPFTNDSFDEDLLALFGEALPDLCAPVPQLQHTGQLPASLQSVQLALMNCKHATSWVTKHIPIEVTVPLAEHPLQGPKFNSWVDLCDALRPYKDQCAVSCVCDKSAFMNHPDALYCCVVVPGHKLVSDRRQAQWTSAVQSEGAKICSNPFQHYQSMCQDVGKGACWYVMILCRCKWVRTYVSY